MTDSHVVNYQTVDKYSKITHLLILNLIFNVFLVRKISYEYYLQRPYCSISSGHLLY